MMPKASILIHEKTEFPDGFIIEIKVWQLPAVSEERPHGLKYSLFFGRPGERIVAYDNEAGKGDHRHIRDIEEPYEFATTATLIADFRRDVARELAKWTS